MKKPKFTNESLVLCPTGNIVACLPLVKNCWSSLSERQRTSKDHSGATGETKDYIGGHLGEVPFQQIYES